MIRPLALALLWLLALGASAAEEGTRSFEVSFETEDGFRLHGDLVSAADTNAPVAILLHMYRSSREAWAPLVPELTRAGLTVLALDQRTHGESIRQDGETRRVAGIPRDAFGEVVRAGPRDVAAARAFLAEQGLASETLLLVGASYGCTVALLSAERLEGVDGLVLLSPGTSYFDVDVADEARDYPGPVLLVAAEDDPRSAKSARELAEAHAGTDELVVFESGGHGTRLFAAQPELARRVAEFARQVAGR